MPICKSCLKGFNADLNICPHCNHDHSKRSFRALLTLIFLVGFSIFLYTAFFSKYTLTVLYDEIPKQGVIVYPFMKAPQKTNEDGIVRLRKTYCEIEIPNDDEKIKWDFKLDSDTTVKVSFRNKSLEIIQTQYIFFENSYTVTFATIKQLDQSKKALIQQMNKK